MHSSEKTVAPEQVALSVRTACLCKQSSILRGALHAADLVCDCGVELAVALASIVGPCLGHLKIEYSTGSWVHQQHLQARPCHAECNRQKRCALTRVTCIHAPVTDIVEFTVSCTGAALLDCLCRK